MNSTIIKLVDNITCLDVVPPKARELQSQLDRWRFENPPVPFRQNLFSSLTPKSVLLVEAKLPKHVRRFHVNFIVEAKRGTDIAFHFNPRFDDGNVVLNSHFSGKWEEELLLKSNPFRKNSTCSFEIFVTSEEFLVSVDRCHFARFAHRMPFNEVNKIEICGDILLLSSELTMKDFYPPSAVSNNIYLHERLKVPYTRAFIDPLVPSSLITLRGVVPDKAVRFSINFCTAWSANPDIAFHFNVRFDQNYVACNSYHGMKWGTEVTEGWASLPVCKGHNFLLHFHTTGTHFVVNVNGKYFCKFQYRMPLNKIKRLEIIGDVTLKWVNFSSTVCGAELEGIENETIVFDNMVVPFSRALLDPIVPKTNFIVWGTVNNEAIRFTVNLCLDPLKGGDIALHFNPRFDQNYVARNTKLGDRWGVEEAHANGPNPFARGHTFVLEFFVTKEEFLISVNGTHFCSYQHRVSPVEIQQIEIDGDLLLSRVELSTKESYPSTYGSVNSPVLFQTPEKLNCPITYKLRSDEAMDSGKEIQVKGQVKLLPATGFYINIQKGSLYWPHPLVGFHFNIRFNEASTHHQDWGESADHSIVLNTWKDTGWSPNELCLPLDSTLIPGSTFNLTVACSHDSFLPKLNGRPLGKLKYITELKNLDTIYIQGDAFINSIKIS